MPEHVFDSLGTHVEMPENSSFPLAKRGADGPESHACDFGEGTGPTCITTSHGKSGHGVGNTIRRCSSPRRGVHRERPSGSAPIVRFASSASTTPFAATSGTGCGGGGANENGDAGSAGRPDTDGKGVTDVSREEEIHREAQDGSEKDDR